MTFVENFVEFGLIQNRFWRPSELWIDKVSYKEAERGRSRATEAKGEGIAGIGHKPDKRCHVLDVRLFEKANPARDLVRDAAAGQFELQFYRVIVRTIKHRDFV